MTDNMLRFVVYHATVPDNTGRTIGRMDRARFPADFTAVAAVELPDTYPTNLAALEHVYQLTNHIYDSWYNNPEVTVLVQSRSTSVGDVVVDPKGDAFYVASFGFKPLTGDTVPTQWEEI